VLNAWWFVFVAPICFAAGWWWRIRRGPPRDSGGKFTGA
jgi:hypothetical protein